MSREERAIKVLINVQSQFQASLDEVDVDEDCKEAEEDNTEIVNALEMAIKALKQMDALDKIRAEIEQNAYPIVHGVNNHEKGMTLYGILQIIDKYRKESED